MNTTEGYAARKRRLSGADSPLSFRWCETASAVSPEAWSRCFSTERFARSQAYQRAVEAAAPTGVRFQYLVISRGETVRAIIGCFRYRVPLSIMASGLVRRLMSFMERIWPSIFCVNGFFVGQLTAVCDHLMGLEDIVPEERARLLAECEPEIRSRAAALKTSLLVHKELGAEDLGTVREGLQAGYLIVPSLPGMRLSLPSPGAYSAQLRKKYRTQYKKRQRLADGRGLAFSVHQGTISAELANDIERLYLRVLERSNTQFECLSAAYFSALLSGCPGACVVLCREGEQLVGFMVNVEEKSAFHGLYLGYDPAYRDAAIYFNLIYRSLDVAVERGHQQIHLGQTSYEIKSALGAERRDLFLAVRAANPIVHAILKRFHSQLFPEVEVPHRRAFRDVSGSPQTLSPAPSAARLSRRHPYVTDGAEAPASSAF